MRKMTSSPSTSNQQPATSNRAGIVVIGRNEGERLRVCLESANRSAEAVVYVDSGSTDHSVALAEQLGVMVVQLDLKMPFTAARARNCGATALLESHPEIEMIQFVDGDCEIVDGWMSSAVAALETDPKLAIVCGRVRERYPETSIYNRLCDMEWNTPVGPAKACGGIALIRASAFKAVGGFDPMVIAGEEPEMCVRLRQAGWTIHRIDAEMALHDAAMTRFGQWWKRNIRAGHAYAQGNAMHGKPPDRFREKELRSITAWALSPTITALLLVLVIAIANPVWCWLGLLPLGMYALLGLKIYRSPRRKGNNGRDARLYAAAVVIGKFPQYLGIRKYRASVRSGQRTQLIEYKDNAALV